MTLMAKAVKKAFKHLKKHSLKGLWIATGFCGLLAVLNLDISSQIDQAYKKQLSGLLYVSSPELSSVANVYTYKNKNSSSKNFAGFSADISFENLILALKKKSTEKIFAVIASDELNQCQNWSKDINNITLILRNAHLPEKCLSLFRDQNISFLSFVSDHKVQNHLGSSQTPIEQEFTVDLGKGESVFVRAAQAYLFAEHSDALTANTDRILNFPLAFSRILQINAEDILDESKKSVSLKGKTVFVGMNNDLRGRPYTTLSEQISDDYYLSVLAYNLKEKSFLKKAQSGFYYAFLALIFLQMFFAIQYCTQTHGAFLIAGITLQTGIISVIMPVFLNTTMSFGHGFIAIVFASLHFQFSKRLEMEKVIKRTQKLLSARSLFNNQLLNNKKSYLDSGNFGGQGRAADSDEFDKYFTKLEVVDSIHGVVSQEPDVADSDSDSNSNVDVDVDVDANADAHTQSDSNVAGSNVSKAKASKAFGAEKTKLDSLKPVSINPMVKKIKIENESNPSGTSRIKDPVIRPKIFANVGSDAPKPKDTVIKKAIFSNEGEKNFKIKKPEMLIKKDTEEAVPIKKDLFKIKKTPPAEQKIVSVTPLLVSNFTKLFANNLKRKKVTFSIKNEVQMNETEALLKTDKKSKIFFEALCLQVLSDVPPQTTIVFSSHKAGDFVIHLIKSESQKQFDYKKWIKGSKYFSELADDLKQQGIIIYQNSATKDQNEIAVAIKRIQSKSFEAA